jgi:uncharacterized protein
MLLRFRCKNFRSIREEQEISLVATNTKSDERNESLLDTPIDGVKALRCVAIYGGNASGKSNVVKAISVFSGMVSASQREWRPTGPIPTWDPFALDEVSRNDVTEFQIDFVLDSIVYNYGFRFNDRVILEEWLIDNTRKAKTLFRRQLGIAGISVAFPNKNLGVTSEEARHLDGIKLQTRPNSLFLSSAAQNNHEVLSAVYDWIVKRLRMSSEGGGGWRSLTAEGCGEATRKTQVKALLTFADIGITDFEIAEEDIADEYKRFQSALFVAMREVVPDPNLDKMELTMASMRRHKIVMMHRGVDGKSYPLDFSEESSGTRAYFEMLGPLLDRLRDASGVLIDELESSLHPNLSSQIIRIFSEPSLNPKGAQLIFTSHDTNLLDLDLLRRDQIWFTEKGRDGATALIRLSDFKPRRDQNIAAAYLHGRFGAIPFLDQELLRQIAVSESEGTPIPGSIDEASDRG